MIAGSSSSTSSAARHAAVEVARAGDVAAERADGLRERPDLDVDAPVHVEVVDGAAAVPAEHAAGMRVVHHHDRAEFFGRVAEAWQRAEVAVHAEDAVGDEQLALGGGEIAQDAARGVDVLVGKHLDLGARQTAAVDDAGVVQGVGDDHVVLGEDRRDRARVGREAALEDHDGFRALELGEPALELDVHGHRARDGANRPGADAKAAHRVEGRLAQPRVRRQPEVVVGGQVDDAAMVEGGMRLLLVLEYAKRSIEALCLERIELRREEGERVGAARRRHAYTLSRELIEFVPPEGPQQARAPAPQPAGNGRVLAGQERVAVQDHVRGASPGQRQPRQVGAGERAVERGDVTKVHRRDAPAVTVEKPMSVHGRIVDVSQFPGGEAKRQLRHHRA
jgi:hypothetical protein